MISGTTLIRRALNRRRSDIPSLAKELYIAPEALETFVSNDKAQLGPKVLDALAKRLLGGGVTFDPDLNLIRMAAKRE
jgi:hypothetical protein